jgi:hypothetical protein
MNLEEYKRLANGMQVTIVIVPANDQAYLEKCFGIHPFLGLQVQVAEGISVIILRRRVILIAIDRLQIRETDISKRLEAAVG